MAAKPSRQAGLDEWEGGLPAAFRPAPNKTIPLRAGIPQRRVRRNPEEGPADRSSPPAKRTYTTFRLLR